MTQDISPELVERMVAVIRAYANGTGLDFVKVTGRSVFAESVAIAESLPAIDPDLIEARKMVAAWHPNARVGEDFIAGLCDDQKGVQQALTAIKRGRELERQS